MRSVLFLFCLLASTIGLADGNGVMIQTILGRSTQKLSYASTTEVENTISHFDLKITYSWATGIYAGGLYSNLQNISATGNDSRSGVAVVLGYQLNAYYLDFAYFIASQMIRANGYTYDSGASFAINFGYNFKIASSILLGLGVVYKSFYWTQSQLANVKSLAVNSMYEFYPAVNIGYTF